MSETRGEHLRRHHRLTVSDTPTRKIISDRLGAADRVTPDLTDTAMSTPTRL